jgi:aldehyde dehydrogenase (NAD+)
MDTRNVPGSKQKDTASKKEALESMRSYFRLGTTRSYDFRKKQLVLFRLAILEHEKEIADALYSDLKKSPEESYGTETGLLLAEIRVAIKHLRQWMRPRRVTTNLVNLPSTSRIYRDPLGVVLIIAPWNYPFQLALIPLVGAIAAGNVVVVKPSELAPATAVIIEKILRKIFVPEYIRVELGEGSVLVPLLMDSFRFDHIFYTGSIAVGKAIYQRAAADLIPVTLELGGKSPVVIEEDADLHIAARRIAFGKFTNAGQTCIAPDYALVHASVKDLFMERFKQVVLEFYGTDPSESSNYGRIINEKRFEKLESYLLQGRIIMGGHHDKSKLYIEPTVLEKINPDAPVMQEEIFGPILPLFVFHKMEEAVQLMEQHPDPLAFYLFTGSSDKEKDWIGKVPFGGGCVNNTAWHFANHHIPFGGIGNSGLGAYHGKYSFEVFSHAKPVLKTPVWPDLDLKYPPFQGKLKWFKRFIK